MVPNHAIVAVALLAIFGFRRGVGVRIRDFFFAK
jgi:hypothetical protein